MFDVVKRSWARVRQGRGHAGFAAVGATLAVGCMTLGVMIGSGLRPQTRTAAPALPSAPTQSVDIQFAPPPKPLTSSVSHQDVPLQRPTVLRETLTALDDPLPAVVAWDPDDPLPPIGNPSAKRAHRAYDLDAPLPPDDSLDQMLARLRLDEPLPPR